MELEGNATTERFSIDPEYFIQLAIQKQIPWNTLGFMLTDLTTTLERSKQVIRVLVQKLEKWVAKIENDSNQNVTDAHVANKKQTNVQIQDQKENLSQQNVEENFECSDNGLDNESIAELTQSERSKQVFDFPANEYYEFIANNEKASTDPEEPELLKYETSLNYESEERPMTEEDFEETEFEVQNELLKQEKSKAEVYFPADEFYEFIGNKEKPNSRSSLNDKTILNSERHQEKKEK